MAKKPASDLGLALGQRIRRLRQQHGLTLRELSDASGVSVSYISQVERENAVPSLGTLAQVAAALDVSIDFFISSPRQADCVTRANSRNTFSVSDSPLAYEQIGAEFPGHELTSFIVNMPVGYKSEVTRHEGEEIIFVLEGTIRQELNGQIFDLTAGDSIHYLGHLPHRWQNAGDIPARALWTGKMLHGATPSSYRPAAPYETISPTQNDSEQGASQHPSADIMTTNRGV